MSEYDSELSKLVDQLNRSVAVAKTAEKRALDPLLAGAVERRASDLILVAGSPVTMRVNGALIAESGPALGAEEIRGMLLPLLTGEQPEELQRQKALDFCFVR
jgi:twitching motility protein PilT